MVRLRPKRLADNAQLELAAPRNTLQFELYSECIEAGTPSIHAAGLPLVKTNHVGRLQGAIDGIDRGTEPQSLDPAEALVYVSALDSDGIDAIRNGYTITGFEVDDLHNRACLACSSDQHEPVNGELLVYMGDQYVHGECIQRFNDILGAVWEYTDTLLGDQL